jgi:hypothetical protein
MNKIAIPGKRTMNQSSAGVAESILTIVSVDNPEQNQ